MRVLSVQEVDEVAGGDAISVAAGAIAAIIHDGGMAGMAIGAALFAGMGLGAGFNAAFEASMGQSFGSWLWDVTH